MGKQAGINGRMKTLRDWRMGIEETAGEGVLGSEEVEEELA